MKTISKIFATMVTVVFAASTVMAAPTQITANRLAESLAANARQLAAQGNPAAAAVLKKHAVGQNILAAAKEDGLNAVYAELVAEGINAADAEGIIASVESVRDVIAEGIKGQVTTTSTEEQIAAAVSSVPLDDALFKDLPKPDGVNNSNLPQEVVDAIFADNASDELATVLKNVEQAQADVEAGRDLALTILETHKAVFAALAGVGSVDAAKTLLGEGSTDQVEIDITSGLQYDAYKVGGKITIGASIANAGSEAPRLKALAGSSIDNAQVGAVVNAVVLIHEALETTRLDGVNHRALVNAINDIPELAGFAHAIEVADIQSATNVRDVAAVKGLVDVAATVAAAQAANLAIVVPADASDDFLAMIEKAKQSALSALFVDAGDAVTGNVLIPFEGAQDAVVVGSYSSNKGTVAENIDATNSVINESAILIFAKLVDHALASTLPVAQNVVDAGLFLSLEGINLESLTDLLVDAAKDVSKKNLVATMA